MRVDLAGYNIDAEVLKEIEQAGVSKERLTPEVLSAAYARISRDPRTITELRRVALEEVEKARTSNRMIIFEMGHHSVAEHAVFNFDLIGVSRLAIESIEWFRLCSYTEKSQRYITLDHDFVIPLEIRGTSFEQQLRSLIEEQSKAYEKFNSVLRDRLSKMYPDLEKKKSGRRLLNGLAKEDARYVTILATTGQLGLTANARNLELMVRRFAASKLEEVKEVGRLLYEKASAVAPSLLLFTEASSHDEETLGELNALVGEISPDDPPPQTAPEDVALVFHTPNADRMVAAALIQVINSAPFAECQKTAMEMSEETLNRFFQTAMRRMEFFDSPSREFEHVVLTFEMVLSSSAYAQLKRHRMTTQSVGKYDPDLGLTVPPSIIETGLANEFQEAMDRAEDLFSKLVPTLPDVAPYALTNAHRRRVLITTNLRELYHFVRLREDAHAQWDIRTLSRKMREMAAEVMPLGALLLCGKDSYVERYKKVFGQPPTILPPEPPIRPDDPVS